MANDDILDTIGDNDTYAGLVAQGLPEEHVRLGLLLEQMAEMPDEDGDDTFVYIARAAMSCQGKFWLPADADDLTENHQPLHSYWHSDLDWFGPKLVARIEVRNDVVLARANDQWMLLGNFCCQFGERFVGIIPQIRNGMNSREVVQVEELCELLKVFEEARSMQPELTTRDREYIWQLLDSVELSLAEVREPPTGYRDCPYYFIAVEAMMMAGALCLMYYETRLARLKPANDA